MNGESALDALQRVPLFAGLDAEADAAVADAVERMRVPVGSALIAQGDASDALYVVLRGRFIVERLGDDGSVAILSEISAGELVGEMAMLSAEPRAATVRAVRESEVLRLTRDAFEELAARHPELMRRLASLLAMRLRHANAPKRPKEKLRTVALIPHDASVDLSAFARDLEGALVVYKSVVSVRAGAEALNPDQVLSEIAALDREGRVLLLVGDIASSEWNDIILSQADVVLVVAHAASSPAPGAVESAASRGLLARRELVLLHEPGTEPSGTARWLDGRGFARHHHLRRGDDAHLHRLARRIAGCSIGLVLGGGGARGFAHIGAVRALRELGVPIDRVGGTSMGSIMAAQVALDWEADRMHARTRAEFWDDPLAWDNTLPLISKITCNKVVRLFQNLLGDARAEDCWLPYFSVACNLTTATTETHRTGPLWQCVRSSSALPGLGPPVIRNGEFIVDGAILDNLPAQVLADEGIGPVIAINVSPREDLGTPWPDSYRMSGWRILWERLRGTAGAKEFPSALWVLQRTVLLGSVGMAERMKGVASLYMHLPVGDFEMFKWREIDPIVATGYEASREPIAEWAESLSFRA